MMDILTNIAETYNLPIAVIAIIALIVVSFIKTAIKRVIQLILFVIILGAGVGYVVLANPFGW